MLTRAEAYARYAYDGRLFKWTPPEQHWHIGNVSRAGRGDIVYDSDGIEVGSNPPANYVRWLREVRRQCLNNSQN